MGGPICVYAAHTIGTVEGDSCWAGVTRFKRVNVGGLDFKRLVRARVEHGTYNHTSHLGSDDIICHSDGHFLAPSFGQESQRIVVDGVEIFSVLMTVVQTSTSDLWILTSAVETSGGEWI